MQPKEIPVKIKSASPEQGTAEKRTAKKRTAKKRTAEKRTAEKRTAKKRSKARPVASRRVKRSAKRVKRSARRTSRERDDFDDLLGVAPAKKKAQKPESDDMDDLLAVAPRSRPTSKSKQQAAPAGLPVQPSKASIRATMRSVLPRIRSCHDKHRQTGTIRVSLTIRGNGTADVDIIGAFAGTPTGFCVLGALERRTFPRFTGKPVRLVYPYNLQ